MFESNSQLKTHNDAVTTCFHLHSTIKISSRPVAMAPLCKWHTAHCAPGNSTDVLWCLRWDARYFLPRFHRHMCACAALFTRPGEECANARRQMAEKVTAHACYTNGAGALHTAVPMSPQGGRQKHMADQTIEIIDLFSFGDFRLLKLIFLHIR